MISPDQASYVVKSLQHLASAQDAASQESRDLASKLSRQQQVLLLPRLS